MKKYFLYSLVVSLVVLVLMSPILIKVKTECKSQFGECPKEVDTKLKTLDGKSLVVVRKEVKKILATNYLISNFSTQLKLPNILQINVIAKKPQFSILNKSQNSYLLIDGAANVLYVTDRSDLPTLIKENADEKPGDKISDQDMFALNLIQGINQVYQVGIGTIQNDTLVVDMPLGIRVILPLSGYDAQVLLGSLRLIYTKVTTSYVGIYSQIDMRFKNPVIR